MQSPPLDGAYREAAVAGMASVRHGSTRGQAWFCTTGLPSDVVFEVHDMSFHLHKFPLMSKSRKIHRMLTEQEEQRPARGRRRRRRSSDGADAGAAETEIEEAEEEEDLETEEQQQVKEDRQPYRIAFPDFPGGPGTFEAAAKFCYGVRVDLTAWNVAPLRCAAEYLEMTEAHAEDNLAARAEAFLEHTVLRHPGEATKALKSCEDLLPLAEDLGVVSRCVDAIASSAAAATAMPRPWCDDLAVLGLRMYKRVMAAMAAREDARAARESCVVAYARGNVPGLSRSMRRRGVVASAPVASEVEQREVLEAVVASLPVPDADRLRATGRRAAHPRLTAEERDTVVGVLDCRKLTVEACTHAAQNERLPLRAVLQVLFFEQLQLRRAITSTLLAAGPAGQQARRREQRPASSRGDSQVLRLDMDSVASRVQELERECSSMRRAIKKIDGRSSAGSRSPQPQGSAEGAAKGWRARHGCKFSTQVCDSHARNVVASNNRASRMGMSP
ncbi:hypothetical protein PR202_gb11026 [Eleusine coracana subsp. coracana]|uniref:NPH3 domain-containing protein n=1 Tax=Eleusine coracana subsp. coracana TaxID=191504 RepID=A0AAV5ELI1_ELECO|nr:hypothetical protein PR202_gb11026 [Eleusine coracana subsp. coracana]